MPNRDITIAELPVTTVAADNSYIPIDNGDITYKIKVSDYNAGANATARAYAEAASTSANSASASAGNASTYAANASQSAQDASNSANTALNHSNNASLYANNAYEYAAAASTSASNATSQAQQVSDYAREAGEKSEDAEAFAVGKRGGVDVNEEDEAYENNAKYYKEQASAEVARISGLTANVSSDALKAEGYAVGTQNGSPIFSEYLQNNAKYYAENAASSAQVAEFSKNTAVQYANKAERAVVKAPYIGDNNHWYVYDFSQEEYVDTTVNATGNPGTPGEKGDNGITPTITATASVDNTSGTPSVTVQKSGSNTNPSFAFAFSGLKGQPGDGSGTSYDDTELREDIADIWKVQGEVGSKNLLKYPYHDTTMVSAGITFTDNKDGSVTLNGTSTSYPSYLFVLREYNLEPGAYILSCAETLPQGVTIDCGEANTLDSDGITNRYAQVKLDEHVARFNVPSDTRNFAVRIQFDPNITVDNLTLHVMIRYGTDTDNTWQPYAPTNYEFREQIENVKSEFDYPPIKGITCWGDSLTVDPQGWVKILSELSEIPTYNAGTGGENVYTITARQGADVMMINNITIPATTTPILIATRAEGGIDTYFGGKALPDLQPNSCLNPVRIGNIEGNLTWTGSAYDDQNGTWTFTRATAGEEIIIDRPTAIRTNYDVIHNNTNELMIIYMGTNHGYADIEDLINKHRLMIDHFKGKEYLVLGFSYGDSQSQADYEAAMKVAFGRRFVSLRQYLAHPIYENGDIVSCYGLADQGLTPTETSLQEIARGAVPKQILRDDVHYTQGTHEVIGKMLYRKLKELNIL